MRTRLSPVEALPSASSAAAPVAKPDSEETIDSNVQTPKRKNMIVRDVMSDSEKQAPVSERKRQAPRELKSLRHVRQRRAADDDSRDSSGETEETVKCSKNPATPLMT